MTEWSEPDARGVRTLTLFLRPKRRISGERRRRVDRHTALTEVQLEQEHRRLLRDLLVRFQGEWHWNRVLRVAGHERVEIASSLVEALLERGYVEIVERRDARGWQPHKVIPVATEALRGLGGLPDLAALSSELATARAYVPRTAPVQELSSQLEAGRMDIRLRRARLMPFVDDWILSGRSGTRRDFALYATGDTKGVEDADWRWLEASSVLEPAGIVDHIPLLLVGGVFSLIDARECRLDVAAAQGPLGLPESAITRAKSITSPPAWIVIENRTVFDKACALQPTCGVLWVPGYAPNWWLAAVEALLERASASLVLACDPDPAGIEISLRVIRLWEVRGLAWKTVGMNAADLLSLPSRRELTTWDRATLERLSDLPPGLSDLRLALLESGVKGEQEGFFDESRLSALLKVGS
jgi:hypothetical protein